MIVNVPLIQSLDHCLKLLHYILDISRTPGLPEALLLQKGDLVVEHLEYNSRV